MLQQVAEKPDRIKRSCKAQIFLGKIFLLATVAAGGRQARARIGGARSAKINRSKL